MISKRLREGRTAGTDLRWHVTDIHREAADVIDALVAAAEKARWYVEVYDTREHNSEQDAVLTQIDAALARARRK